MATYELIKSVMLLILVRSTCTLTVDTVQAGDCEVTISLPWERRLFIPRGSLVSINCTVNITDESDIENSLEWSVRLPDRQIYDRFTTKPQKKILNNRGFYELAPIVTTLETIRLVINKTDEINGTVLRCANILSGELVQETTLFVNEPTPVMITEAKDIDVHSAKLTWSSPEVQEQTELGIKVNYILKVVSASGKAPSPSFQLEESSYVFTAPEDAPPCEVYNFSLTSTYVGATYTGAGCSVPSPVHSWKLPSLPDISRLESSLKYSIKRESTDSEGITLNVTFQLANYCDSYPVTDYILKVEGPLSSSHIMKTSLRNFISVDNLSDNQIYTFSIVVSNAVGNISTSKQEIYTTDIQKVIVIPLEEPNAFLVQCIFLTGSIAKGCMVMLIGELNSLVVNLTRNSMCTTDILDATHPLSNYSEVIAYDIESDGSIGTLTIYGILLMNASSMSPCMASGLSSNPTTPFPVWLIGVILGVSLLATIFVIVLFIIICRKIMRSKETSELQYYLQVSRPHVPDAPPTTTQQLSSLEQDCNTLSQAATPVYDLPETCITGQKMEMRSSGGDGIDYDIIAQNHEVSHGEEDTRISTQDSQHIPSHNVKHMYHVLETPCYQLKPQHLNRAGNTLIMAPDSDCVSPDSHEQMPIYQDITEFSTSIEAANQDHGKDNNQEFSKMDPQSILPVY